MKHYNQPQTKCLTLHTQAMVMQTASPGGGEPVYFPYTGQLKTMTKTSAEW